MTNGIVKRSFFVFCIFWFPSSRTTQLLILEFGTNYIAVRLMRTIVSSGLCRSVSLSRVRAVKRRNSYTYRESQTHQTKEPLDLTLLANLPSTKELLLSLQILSNQLFFSHSCDLLQETIPNHTKLFGSLRWSNFQLLRVLVPTAIIVETSPSNSRRCT